MEINYNSNNYWGEINKQNSIDSIEEFDFRSIFSDLSDIKENNSILNPDHFQQQIKLPESSTVFECQNSLVLHTIALHKYVKELQSLISDALNYLHGMRTGDSSSSCAPPDQPPAIPEYQNVPLKHQINQSLTFLPPDVESRFVRGLGQKLPEIEPETNNLLLRKAIATLAAHIGFTTSQESALTSLVSVAGKYMQQMTQLMRHSVDHELMTGSTGFSDTMERVFHEMGIGNPRTLHDFYQNRIVLYHDRLLKTCSELQDEYNKLLDEISTSTGCDRKRWSSGQSTPRTSVKSESYDSYFQVLDEVKMETMDPRLNLFDMFESEDQRLCESGDMLVDSPSSSDALLSPPAKSSKIPSIKK